MEENNETIAGFEVFSNPEDLAASTNEAQEQPVVEQAPVKKTVTRSKKDPEPVVDSDVAALDEEFDDGWVEDKDGNFVPKGE